MDIKIQEYCLKLTQLYVGSYSGLAIVIFNMVFFLNLYLRINAYLALQEIKKIFNYFLSLHSIYIF